ncbi:hypothetical protein ACFQ7G_19685 [Streptomyces massasporeus]
MRSGRGRCHRGPPRRPGRAAGAARGRGRWLSLPDASACSSIRNSTGTRQTVASQGTRPANALTRQDGPLLVRLALLLRRRDQAARALTLTLKFAGGSTWTKTRRLAEPSHHDDDLRTAAYQLMDAAGLQRGRLTGLTLKGEDLLDADQVAQQISLDTAREARLVAEAAIDRVRDKYGPGIIGPAAAFRHAS